MSIFRDFFVKEKPVFTGITRGVGGFSFGAGGGGGGGGNAPITATGGNSTATPGNGYKYHIFTSSDGTGFNITSGQDDVEFLVVAGGGTGGSYTGSGYVSGNPGNDSKLGPDSGTPGTTKFVAYGGGGGGSYSNNPGANGGAGGGGGTSSGSGGIGLNPSTPAPVIASFPDYVPGTVQGYNGGSGGGGWKGGGSGGDGRAIPAFAAPFIPGQPSPWVTAVGPTGLYGGGGGQGGWNSTTTAGVGGAGGGGNGAISGTGSPGTAGTGGGGGAGDNGSGAGHGGGASGGVYTGTVEMSPGPYAVVVGDGGTAGAYQGSGGKGIVIVRYSV